MINDQATAQSLYVISYRKDFWNSGHIAHKAQLAIVSPDGSLTGTTPDLEVLSEKNIVVVIHGFNVSEEDVLVDYFTMQKQLAERVINPDKPIYDQMIGVAWPGYQSRLDYSEAEKNVDELAQRLRADLDHLASIANRVDVIAHSLGNRFIFDALKLDPKEKPIQNLFSLAPAIGDESIDKGKVYAPSIQKCRNVFIFHSNEDDVLKFLYPLADHDEALGYVGPVKEQNTDYNIQSIDCSEVVKGHSDYWNATQIYDFIREELLGKVPSPPKVKDLKILADGSYRPIKQSLPWYEKLFQSTTNAMSSLKNSVSQFFGKNKSS